MGTEIKTKFDIGNLVYAIVKRKIKTCSIFEIIVRQELFGRNKIYYHIRDKKSKKKYIVEENNVAFNEECLNEILAINKGEKYGRKRN